MSTARTTKVHYPSSDGKPMAECTQQARWMAILYHGLAGQYSGDPNVFVSLNQLWYPVEGNNRIRTAPDVYVVFGRPPGDRGSYMQWEEANIPMTVVFEILSPGNRAGELRRKLHFYDTYGVSEYYLYDPIHNRLTVYWRQGAALVQVPTIFPLVSPRLRIRWDYAEPELRVIGANGLEFLAPGPAADYNRQLLVERNEAEQAALQAEFDLLHTAQVLHRTEQAKNQAEQHAATQTLALARLAELSRKARRGQATPAELTELDALETQATLSAKEPLS